MVRCDASLLRKRPMKEPRWSIAFVVPRYGAETVGGAEALTRGFAERLPRSVRVEVLTTCARDHPHVEQRAGAGGRAAG